jgi:hypothetical protein
MTGFQYGCLFAYLTNDDGMVQVAKALAGTSAALSPRTLIKLQAQVQAMVRCLNCPGGPWYEQETAKN